MRYLYVKYQSPTTLGLGRYIDISINRDTVFHDTRIDTLELYRDFWFRF